MAARRKATARRLAIWKPFRILAGHAILASSITAGFASLIAMPGYWPLSTRLILGWDIGCVLYLSIAAARMVNFDVRRVRRRAAQQDEGAIAVLIATTLAVATSFAAVVILLASGKNTGANQIANVALAILTIILSWLMMHMIFAVHYAHEYYGDGNDYETGGLSFPGRREPDYWDFLYFSYVIGMTFQVSDVQVTSHHLRRIVVAHGIASFFFTAAILSLAVNIGSSLI